MTAIWHRDWELTLGTTRLAPAAGQALDVNFEVTKSLAREPNTATVKVWNLGPLRRSSITQGAQLELKVGYLNLTSTLFVGEARRISTVREGPDLVTTVESRDGGREYRTTRLDRGWAIGTPVPTVVAAAVDAMGVGRGNLDQYTADLTIEESGSSAFDSGYTSSGPAWRVLSQLLGSCGLRYSVQNGALQVRHPGQPTERTAIMLSPGTGLIGSPTVDAGARGQGQTVTALAQLLPGLYPGRIVALESSAVEGTYRIKTSRYAGDTSTDEWQVSLLLEAY